MLDLMFGPGEPTPGFGLMLVAAGLGIIGCVLTSQASPARTVPGVLVGISLIAFGWSVISRHRRKG